VLRRAAAFERDPVKCFCFIAAEVANHPISLVCRVLGVSRSGCSAWERRPPCERTLTDAWLIARIRVMHVRSGDSDGARRVFLDLREEGICVGKERVERRMRIAGLCGYVKGREGTTRLRVRGVRAASGLVGAT
jgi:putative transposase